ncbi:cross-pathway control 1 [Rostrohypoxylon terebratum]|nr:cross-pathway control 1 [Rostrohypoxylon terebratum]
MDLQGKSLDSLDSVPSEWEYSQSIDALQGLPGGGATPYSPAMPSYDGSMSSTPGSMENFVVSPNQLQLDHFSAPNSAAMTALTTPSLPNDSPDLFDNSFETSPFVGGNEIDNSNWFPLFDSQPIANSSLNIDSLSPIDQPEDIAKTDNVSRPRAESSASHSTKTFVKRVSEGGVTKSKKPLPNIIIEDENDSVAVKRARNTMAARKSRARRAEKIEYLEKRVQELEEDNGKLKEESAGLREENTGLKSEVVGLNEQLAYYKTLAETHGLC